MSSAPNQLSFLPDDYLESKRQRRTNVICAVLFLLIMGAIGIAFSTIERALRAAERENQDVNQKYAEAASRIEQDKEMQEKQKRMAGQAELTASLLEKVPRSVLLAELTNAKPGGLSFLDLTLDSKVRQSGAAGAPKTQFEMKRAAAEAAAANKSPAVAQAKLYDVTVKVTGVADSDLQVAQFMARLNRSKLVRDVNLVISEAFTLNDTKMRKFTVDMSLDPDAEVESKASVKGKDAAAAPAVTADVK
jgi:hypothetical protein